MVNGLSTFESRVVHVELEALTLELDLFIPKLRVIFALFKKKMPPKIPKFKAQIIAECSELCIMLISSFYRLRLRIILLMELFWVFFLCMVQAECLLNLAI
jgi:hypothetical protein